jgi:hypothetical protein
MTYVLLLTLLYRVSIRHSRAVRWHLEQGSRLLLERSQRSYHSDRYQYSLTIGGNTLDMP